MITQRVARFDPQAQENQWSSRLLLSLPPACQEEGLVQDGGGRSSKRARPRSEIDCHYLKIAGCSFPETAIVLQIILFESRPQEASLQSHFGWMDIIMSHPVLQPSEVTEEETEA